MRSLRPWALVTLVAVAACADDRIVEVDRDLVGNVPAAAAGYVGYYDVATKRTTCGQCHAGMQAEWQETAHADAWATLENSGGSQPFCEGCHTVSEKSPGAGTPAGYTTTQDKRYHDVQCESCHGPGLDHVKDPDRSVVPLAPMTVGLEPLQGCATCHSGSQHPYAEEWAASKHGSPNAYPAGRAGCADCHAGEDVLVAWGFKVDYVEKEALAQAGEHMGITCSVCHDPHAATRTAQLRFAIDVASEEDNLCMKCHHKRGEPDLTAASRGPHSPEGPLLLGTAGWRPASMEAMGPQVMTHGSEQNPRLCAGCHVQSSTVKDPVTGSDLGITGHSFQATPCVDATGRPTPGPCEPSQKSVKGCLGSGCHGAEVSVRSALAVSELRLERLAGEIDLLLKKVPATEFNDKDGRYSTAEGARFNAGLARAPGTTVHNPFLVETLLIESIKQVRSEYGLAAETKVSLETAFNR